MGFTDSVVENKEDIEAGSYRNLGSQGSQWQAVGLNASRLIRRVDGRILPLLFTVYFLQFMDKIVLNYANVMGLQKGLNMTGDDFSWAGTAFFIGYGLAEFPQGALLQRFTVTKVLAANVLCWGIVTSCTAAIQSSRELLALRTILGIFESVVTPSLIMITAAWYRRREGAPRFGIWFCGLGAGQIVGGLVSFAAQHSKITLQGWRLMFLVIGLLNILISGFIWRLPASPDRSTFLTPLEANFMVQRLKDDHAGVGPKVVRKRSVVEAFLDLQTWLLCLITVLTTICAGLVTYYSAVLIEAFGYNAKDAALLNMPSGVVSIIATLGVVCTVSNGWQRWIAIVIASIPPAIGGCLMSFLPSNSKPGLLIGIYLVNTAPSVYALVLSTVGANYRGYTRKIAGGAIIAASFSIGNIIAPQTFQARDAPQYLPAKITLIVVMGAAIVVALGLRLLYGFRNSRADKYEEPAMSHFERNAVIKARANLDFSDSEYRYSY